jgi:hypothetical protein
MTIYDYFNRILAKITYSRMPYKRKPPTNVYKETGGAVGVCRTHGVRHYSKFSPKTEVEERVLEMGTWVGE